MLKESTIFTSILNKRRGTPLLTEVKSMKYSAVFSKYYYSFNTESQFLRYKLSRASEETTKDSLAFGVLPLPTFFRLFRTFTWLYEQSSGVIVNPDLNKVPTEDALAEAFDYIATKATYLLSHQGNVTLNFWGRKRVYEEIKCSVYYSRLLSEGYFRRRLGLSLEGSK